MNSVQPPPFVGDLAAYEGLARFLPGAVFRYRVMPEGTGRLEHMTEACLEIWELDRQVLEHDMGSLWAMVDPQDLPLMRARVDECARTLTDWDHEWRIVTPSGRRKWLHGVGRPTRERDGSLLWHVLVVDQTNNRVAQESQRISEQRFRRLIESIPNVAVQGYDAQLVCRFWNAASVSLYGYTEEEAIGRGLLDLIIPEHMHERVRRAVDDMLRHGDAIPSEELVLRHKDGSAVPVYSGHVVLRHAGAAPEFFCIDFDLSERQRAEAARHQLQAQLREAQKMEALGTLAGGIAHDFNNILAAILGNTSLALEDAPPEGPLRESLDEVQKAARRARAVVRQILAFARKEVLERQVADVGPVVREAYGLLRATAPPGVQVLLSADEALPTVLVDATQLEQVLLNLGTNALHAVAGQFQGQVALSVQRCRYADACEVSATRVLDAGLSGEHDGVLLRVTDNGKGIPADALHRIFEPFFTTKARGQGTGLGLAVVHGILKEHHACLTVRSSEGAGTAFAVWLASVGATARTGPAVAQEVPALPVRLLRILYVDDDEQINRVVQRMLVREGHAVEVLSDTDEVLARLQSGQPGFDVAILDHNMPKVAGLELARMVLQVRPEVPVVLVSAVVDDELRALARHKGVMHVVEKSDSILQTLVGIAQTVVGVRPAQPASDDS